MAMSAIGFNTAAQQIPRTVVAEHFTNTYCSICASRNPGLFANLNNFPQVLHVAYYPSAPYASCPLSMHNSPESDARTNYYGAYGSTPRLFICGNQVSSFTPPSIYTSQLSVTTSFALTTSVALKGTDSISVQVTVKKVDTSSLTSLELYSAALEDTLFFTANNGETKHYNVFRKSFWGTTSLNIMTPAAVGDSAVYVKTIARNAAWNINRMYAIAILQKADKGLVQASRSANVSGAATAANGVTQLPAIKLYPNPATTKIFIEGHKDATAVVITDAAGRVVKHTTIDKADNSIDVSSLERGSYFFKISDGKTTRAVRFIK